MKIIQLPRRFVTSEWGGTETVVLETAKRLEAMGLHNEIFCSNALAVKNREVIDGISVNRFPYFYPYLGVDAASKDRLDKKGGNLFSVSLMRALMEYPDLDLLHLHTGKRLGGIARWVAKRRRIPYVISLHGGAYDVPAEEARTWTAPTAGSFEWGKILGWMVGSRRVLEDAAAIICVGRGEHERCVEKFPNNRVEFLPNGVDVKRFADGDGKRFRTLNQIDLDAPMILNVGRIDRQKNQLALIEMFPRLRRNFPNLQLVLIGPVTDRNYRDELVSAADKSGAKDSIRIIEGLKASDQELVDAYHAANLFVLPSRHEPFGIVVLEAWAAALPVIASDVGGLSQLVTNGKNGLLTTPENHRELAVAVETVLGDRELARELGHNGLITADTSYDWDRITGRLKSIYEDVAGSGIRVAA